MAASEGRPRFECPADFCPCPFSPGPAFSQKTLRRHSKQLWLIQAPANFHPESLDGQAVPLLGSQMLKVPQPDGAQKVYSVQATPGDLDSAHLLIPASHQDRLACASPFRGSLSICERHGNPSASQPLFPVAARLAPQIPHGLRQRFLPFGGHPPGPALREVAEAPPRKRRRKKHERHLVGAPEDLLPPEHKPHPGGASVEAAGGAERGRRPRQGEALWPALGAAPQLLPEEGSQPSPFLEGASQESLSSLRSRKKRKKQLLKEEAEELPQQQPGGEESCFQGSPVTGGGAAEGLGHCRPKKQQRQEEEGAAVVASVDMACLKQEAESGQWDAGALAESLSRGRHKKRKKEKVKVEEEQEAEAAWLGPSPVQQDSPGGWAELEPGPAGGEGAGQTHRKKKEKKKKKHHHHRREAAEEESWAS